MKPDATRDPVLTFTRRHQAITLPPQEACTLDKMSAPYRRLVGYISGAYRTTVPNDAVMLNFPIIVRVMEMGDRSAPFSDSNDKTHTGAILFTAIDGNASLVMNSQHQRCLAQYYLSLSLGPML